MAKRFPALPQYPLLYTILCLPSNEMQPQNMVAFVPLRKKAKALITKGFRFIESARRDSNHTAISPSGQNEKCLQLSTTFWRTQKTGIPYKSRKFQPLKKARDGIRTLPMSGKLIKSRRNAHCLKCVYRLSTTCKSEWKAVKGSAEQIHFTPLLLVVAVEITHY